MKKRKSWQEKLATTKDLPKMLVIPAPYEVDELMRQVPRGKLTTIEHLREALDQIAGTRRRLVLQQTFPLPIHMIANESLDARFDHLSIIHAR